MSISGTCLSCGERFNGVPPLELRAHLDAHPLASYPENITEEGEHDGWQQFEFESFVLSCNCGECEFCRSKVIS